MFVSLFVYKTLYYAIENFKGNVQVPIEISSITYFLTFAILTFKIKSLYGVGAFFGSIAGLGFFCFYTLFGLTVAESISIKDLLISCFNHGYLLVCGLYLFKNALNKKDEYLIWITLLAMLCWGLVFYDALKRGITFIYYIIKPTFLFLFDNLFLNSLILMLYYALLTAGFFGVVKTFFKVNKNFEIQKNETIEKEKNNRTLSVAQAENKNAETILTSPRI